MILRSDQKKPTIQRLDLVEALLQGNKHSLLKNRKTNKGLGGTVQINRETQESSGREEREMQQGFTVKIELRPLSGQSPYRLYGDIQEVQ